MALATIRPRIYFKARHSTVAGRLFDVTFMEGAAVLDDPRVMEEGWHVLELLRLTGEFDAVMNEAPCEVCGDDGYVVPTSITQGVWEHVRSGGYVGGSVPAFGHVEIVEPIEPVSIVTGVEVLLVVRQANGAQTLKTIVVDSRAWEDDGDGVDEPAEMLELVLRVLP